MGLYLNQVYMNDVRWGEAMIDACDFVKEITLERDSIHLLKIILIKAETQLNFRSPIIKLSNNLKYSLHSKVYFNLVIRKLKTLRKYGRE